MKNTYEIPEGCNKVTIEQIGNKIVTEFEVEPKFKAGDIIIGKEFYWPRSAKIVESVLDNVCVYDNGTNRCNFKYIRLATQSEKQLLFDALAKSGKKWNAETLQIEDLKVEPKVGDCVKLSYSGGAKVYTKIKSSNDDMILADFWYSTTKGINTVGTFTSYNSIQILTPSQFQSEVNALGFEYDFKNYTFRELKWEPKEGDRCFELTAVEIIYNPKYHKLCNVFKTKSECESAIEKIKNVLKSK